MTVIKYSKDRHMTLSKSLELCYHSIAENGESVDIVRTFGLNIP